MLNNANASKLDKKKHKININSKTRNNKKRKYIPMNERRDYQHQHIWDRIEKSKENKLEFSYLSQKRKLGVTIDKELPYGFSCRVCWKLMPGIYLHPTSYCTECGLAYHRVHCGVQKGCYHCYEKKLMILLAIMN